MRQLLKHLFLKNMSLPYSRPQKLPVVRVISREKSLYVRVATQKSMFIRVGVGREKEGVRMGESGAACVCVYCLG